MDFLAISTAFGCGAVAVADVAGGSEDSRSWASVPHVDDRSIELRRVTGTDFEDEGTARLNP